MFVCLRSPSAFVGFERCRAMYEHVRSGMAGSVDAQLTRGTAEGCRLSLIPPQRRHARAPADRCIVESSCVAPETVAVREVDLSCTVRTQTHEPSRIVEHARWLGRATCSLGVAGSWEEVTTLKRLYPLEWGYGCDGHIAVLTMGAWVDQQATFTQQVEATHPSDGALCVAGWRLIPDILAAANLHAPLL